MYDAGLKPVCMRGRCPNRCQLLLLCMYVCMYVVQVHVRVRVWLRASARHVCRFFSMYMYIRSTECIWKPVSDDGPSLAILSVLVGVDSLCVQYVVRGMCFKVYTAL